MDPVRDRLAALPHAFLLHSVSALDAYFGRPWARILHILTDATLVDLAKAFDAVRYPPAAHVHAAVEVDGRLLLFSCVDEPKPSEPRAPFAVMDFFHDPRTIRRFLDPFDAYPLLRTTNPGPRGRILDWQDVLDAAILVSRFSYEIRADETAVDVASMQPDPESQRIALEELLVGAFPWKGLTLLAETGFLSRFWPELHSIMTIAHAKEYHPEGDAWEHTLETFRYRKDPEFELSLGLLLHDLGKAEADEVDERRFDGHAQIGSGIASDFLRRLGFSADLARRIVFLVENHMLPSALDRMPISRTEKLMASADFPLLLELYRCDVSSTFRGPDGYYTACKVYRDFLRHRRNPYRESDGKLKRQYRK